MTNLFPGQPFPIGSPTLGTQADPGRYVNSVGIRASQWDIAVDLIHQFAFPLTPDPQLANQLVSRVVMSPMHAKALAHVLQTAVDGWQEKFGDLPSIDILLPQPSQEGGTSVA